MFDNIGNKIKTLAKVSAIIGCILSVLYGFILIIFTSLDVEGVLWLILGPLISWLSSFVLYGFGQLVENSDKIKNNFLNDHDVKNTNPTQKIKTITTNKNLTGQECYNYALQITTKTSQEDYLLLTKKYKIWYEQIAKYSLQTLYNIIKNEQDEWQEEYIVMCCFEIVKKYESIK